MRHYLLVITAILLVCCTSKKQSAPTDSNTIQAIEKVNTQAFKNLMQMKGNLQIVDVRTRSEVEVGYIDGAIKGMDFTNGEFENNIDKLDKTKPIVVYCAKGGRSAKAAKILQEGGFAEVYDYTDGYSGWAADQ